MPFREIPRRQWSHFFESFSELHLGCLCSLEVDSSLAGPGLAAHHSPLRGIVYEPGALAPTVQVFVGGASDRHVTHIVTSPVAVWVEEPAEGGDRGLRVDADEGSLRLRFEVVQPSERWG